MKRFDLRIQGLIDIAEQWRTSGLHLSTFDIPRSGSAEYDDEAHSLIVNFRYIDDEAPARWRELADGISVTIGKNSGKLLGLRATSVSAQNKVSDAFMRLAAALGQEIPRLKRYNQKTNYRLVQSVLTGNTVTKGDIVSATPWGSVVDSEPMRF